jgi:hypothetical protein
VGLGLLKQMSPATSILGIPQPFSTTQFPCVFLYTVKDIGVSLLTRLDFITFGPVQICRYKTIAA